MSSMVKWDNAVLCDLVKYSNMLGVESHLQRVQSLAENSSVSCRMIQDAINTPHAVYGLSPLQIAVLVGNTAVVQVLLQYGGRPYQATPCRLMHPELLFPEGKDVDPAVAKRIRLFNEKKAEKPQPQNLSALGIAKIIKADHGPIGGWLRLY